MSDHPEFPPPEEPNRADGSLSYAPDAPPRDRLPLLCGLGFLVLAGGIFAAWEYPKAPGSTSVQAVQAVQQNLAEFDARISRLEQRPASVSQADLDKVAARIDALDARAPDQPRVDSRVDAMSGRIESLSGRIQTGLDSIKEQTDRLAERVANLEKAAGSLDSVSGHLNRLGRIEEASLALAAGRPLGDIPDAPAALARFAHSAPPTEADLRLRFSRSEHAAIEAKQPDDTATPIIDRIWERAQDLVTVHRGDDVVVGNPASVTLARAKVALDTGDLKGAISSVELLKGAPRQAMADWLSEAKSLVDARAALADMAAGQS